MPVDRLKATFNRQLEEKRNSGILKGRETVIEAVASPTGRGGPRFILKGREGSQYIRLNSNDYLGLSIDRALTEAQEREVVNHAVGPGAVRFISGTWASHTALEARLARFHGRESSMIFSSAYAAVLGVLPGLVDESTAVLSDELNHNCIITATKLAQPKHKYVYPHLDLKALEAYLGEAAISCERAVIVTDGVFSMRGDYAPLAQIVDIARRWDDRFDGNVIVMVDDSHGVGAYGSSGRGTEEVEGSESVDILIATLGKAIGVNGGYMVADREIVEYLREVSPLYVYSNPIGPGEASAAVTGLNIIDSERGRQRLKQLRENTAYFRKELVAMKFETIDTPHPIIALLIRDPVRTKKIVDYLDSHGVLVTGLTYPVVPHGEDEIRLQVSASHTRADIDAVLQLLSDSDFV